jgi:perosamine synthetase
MGDFIPVNVPLLNGNEKKYLNECIDSGWISSEGPFVKEFENRFANLVGRKFAVSVTSGSAALEVAFTAVGIEEGDEVTIPTFTIFSCVAPLIRLGAVPIFVDAEPETWNMNVKLVEEKITPRTKAIMAVHIYGMPVDMDPLISIARENNLIIMEDAAEAIGLNYKGKACGGFGHISTFSFYPNKLITTGEGGMIVTDDENIMERCRSLRNLCFQDGKRFFHEELGWNFRMSNLQAAVGLAQLERLSESNEKKHWIGHKYTENLSGMEELIQLPIKKCGYAENIYWVFGIVITDKIAARSANEVMSELKNYGIGTRPFFWPLHKQPVLIRSKLINNDSFPVAENISQKGFYIPSGLGLNEEELKRVSDGVKAVLFKYT